MQKAESIWNSVQTTNRKSLFLDLRRIFSAEPGLRNVYQSYQESVADWPRQCLPIFERALGEIAGHVALHACCWLQSTSSMDPFLLSTTLPSPQHSSRHCSFESRLQGNLLLEKRWLKLSKILLATCLVSASTSCSQER